MVPTAAATASAERRCSDPRVADADDPTADDVARHLDEITASDPYTIPGSIFDEVFQVCDRLGIGR